MSQKNNEKELFIVWKILNRLREKNYHITRWHFELILLGIILSVLMAFISWLQLDTTMILDPQTVSKSVFAIASGIILLAIWVLGISVIMVNLLRDILFELKKIKKKED